MVALSAWKFGKIHDVLASSEPQKILGIIGTLNELPETQVLTDLEKQLEDKVTLVFPTCNTVLRVGNNLDLVDKVTPIDSIDSIVASLSLHIVPDPDLMLRQCFEVLKPGGKASFSVWGEKSDRNYFEIMDEVLAVVNSQPYLRLGKPDSESRFFLGDRHRLISKMQEAGFVEITVNQQFLPFKKLSDSAMKRALDMTIKRKGGVFAEKGEQIRKVYKQIYEQEWNQKNQLVGFNILYAVGMKPFKA